MSQTTRDLDRRNEEPNSTSNSTADPASSSHGGKQNENESRDKQQEGGWEKDGAGTEAAASSSTFRLDAAEEVRLVRVDDETHRANKKLLWKHMRWYAREVKEGRIVPEPWEPKK